MTKTIDPLRAHLARALDWEEAHVSFDKAIAGLAADKRGAVPAGFEHSPWQLVEHIRLAQRDLIDVCIHPQHAYTLTSPQYAHPPSWPEDYWPGPGPADAAAWDASVDGVTADRETLKRLVRDAD